MYTLCNNTKLTISSFLLFAVTIGIATAAEDVKSEKKETIMKKPLPAVAPAENELFFGSRIQRTMTLLHTSNSKHRNPVKILFYGQSIVGSAWSHTLAAELKKRFPDADLVIENHSIGGYTAPTLSRPAIHDVAPFYPDLVVFHVYGGAYSGDLERIISNIRRTTTAEIMLFTHHIRPAEKKMKDDDLDNNAMIYLAQKYNCELVELRKEWRQYVETNNLDPDRFLADGTHPNAEGNKLLTTLVGRHFRFNPLFQCGWIDQVRTYEAKRFYCEGKSDEITFGGTPWVSKGAVVHGSSSNSVLKLTFDGNRIDVIAGKSEKNLGSATILIDGKKPSEYVGTCVFTRPSKAFGSWMPAIRRVTHNTPLIPEDWTLRITEINESCSRFSFEVIGSVTGPDGTGTNRDKKFVSNSGRVVIDKSDFTISWVSQYFKKKCPVGFEVTWKAVAQYVDTYQPPVVEDDAKVYRTTLAQGLENSTHTLEIIPNGDGDIPIVGLQVYRPPLR